MIILSYYGNTMKINNDKNNKKANDVAESSGKKLDKVDCQMIHLLQKDGRMPNNAIAQELGISEFTVRRRMKRLFMNSCLCLRNDT